jgi:predicted nucleic-acid-binding protein
MIGVDTNVLLRLFVDDNVVQHRAAQSFFSDRGPQDPVFVSLVVLAELVWVLTKRYGYSHIRTVELLEGMTNSGDFVIERVDLVREAIDLCRIGAARMVDALVAKIGVAQGCRSTVTFDTRAAKRIPGMELPK